MSTCKSPPEFKSKLKSYDRYERVVWLPILKKKPTRNSRCSVTPGKWLKWGTWQSVELTLPNLNNDEGVTTLIYYFNWLFLKDELSKVYGRYVKFDRCKDSSIKMEDRILEFENFYNRINQKEMTFTAPSALAFKILNGATLNHRDRQLVLTGLDYTNKVTLFDQMRKALRKFHRDQAIKVSSDNTTETAIKIEAILSNEDETRYMKINPYRKHNRILISSLDQFNIPINPIIGLHQTTHHLIGLRDHFIC